MSLNLRPTFTVRRQSEVARVRDIASVGGGDEEFEAFDGQLQVRRACLCVRVCACMSVCVRVCMRACVLHDRQSEGAVRGPAGALYSPKGGTKQPVRRPVGLC